MNQDDAGVSILKTIWRLREDGRWGIHDLKGIELKPRPNSEPDFFRFESEMELMTSSPRSMNVHEIFNSFGPTDFLLKQSILPVIAWIRGESPIRCVGSAFVVSCTGLLITAGHVLLDPQDRNYAKVTRQGSTLTYPAELNMGVLVPISPAYGRRGYRFFPFLHSWYWGQWQDSPLLHQQAQFNFLTDIAICKIAPMPHAAHQPLNLSLRRFSKGEKAYALGYAEMPDIPFEERDGQMVIPRFSQDLYVSVGEVVENFPENHLRRDVPTPGPCFDLRAKMPGRMSGGPIFGGDGAVVRGVVSRSFSGERHAYGAMLGPAMGLPLGRDTTFKKIMDTGNEGIPVLQGPDL